jgi:hypothetical protein
MSGTVALLLLFVLLRMWVGRTSWAFLLFLLLRVSPVLAALAFGAHTDVWSSIATVGATNGLALATMLQFGFLGGLTASLVQGWFINPLTPNWHAWYATPTIELAIAMVLVTTVSLRIATAGRNRGMTEGGWPATVDRVL